MQLRSSEVTRWPTTTTRATLPGCELTATWCYSLDPLVPQTVIRQQRQRALGYGSSCLGAYYARTRGWCWRQPLAADSQALAPEMTNLHHLIGRATDIFTPQVIYWACQCRVHTLCSFICDHVGEPTHSDGQ